MRKRTLGCLVAIGVFTRAVPSSAQEPLPQTEVPQTQVPQAPDGPLPEMPSQAPRYAPPPPAYSASGEPQIQGGSRVVLVQEKPRRLTLAPMAGIQFGGSADTFQGTLDVDFGGLYGGAIDYAILRGTLIEASYTYQATSLSLEQPFVAEQTLFDLSVHHAQIGVLQEFLPGRVRPFAGIGLGVGIFAPHVSNVSTEVRFATHLQLGLNVAINNMIGIRVLGRLMSTFFESSTGVFCGVGTGGSGCSLGVFGGVAQWGFMAGPTFAF